MLVIVRAQSGIAVRSVVIESQNVDGVGCRRERDGSPTSADHLPCTACAECKRAPARAVLHDAENVVATTRRTGDVEGAVSGKGDGRIRQTESADSPRDGGSIGESTW